MNVWRHSQLHSTSLWIKRLRWGVLVDHPHLTGQHANSAITTKNALQSLSHSIMVNINKNGQHHSDLQPSHDTGGRKNSFLIHTDQYIMCEQYTAKNLFKLWTVLIKWQPSEALAIMATLFWVDLCLYKKFVTIALWFMRQIRCIFWSRFYQNANQEEF